MNTDKGLLWLASYPKSGNTWIRLFLRALALKPNQKLNINQLYGFEIASSLRWVEEGLGIDISELSQDEIDLLRPMAYQQLALDEQAKKEPPRIHKIHDAYSYLPNGLALIPQEATNRAIVLVRNPLDIAVSYAHHNNTSTNQSIDLLCDKNHFLGNNTGQHSNQLRQHLWSWSEHVESWLAADIKKLVIRYEDLKLNQIKTFTEIAHFYQLEYSPGTIRNAVHQTSFNRIKKLEDENGFVEKPLKTDHFFRKGIIGDWQNELSKEQINRIIEANQSTMYKMGYLDKNGKARTEPNSVL